MQDETPVSPFTPVQPIINQTPVAPPVPTPEVDRPTDVSQPQPEIPNNAPIPNEQANFESPPRFEEEQYTQQAYPDQAAYQQGYNDSYPGPAVRTLLSWKGNGRPFREHGKEYYINASLIVMIIEVLLFLFSQYVLMLVVISILFVVIALAVVPPHTVDYRVSSEGIVIDEYFYLWQELYDFYFKHVNGEDILHIRTKDEYANDITILLGDIPKDYIRSLLINYLPYREVVPLSFMEKSGDWLTRTFPLDKIPSASK